MGLNTNCIYVFGADVEELRHLGLTPTGQTLAGEVALGHHASSVLRRGSDLLVVDATAELAGAPLELGARLGRRVVAVLIGSTGDTFSLAVADGSRGPAGPALVRHVVDSQGERVVDEGATLPQESAVHRLDEDTTQELFEALTGVLPLSDEIIGAEFELLGEVRGDAPAASAPRRSLWSRLTGRGED